MADKTVRTIIGYTVDEGSVSKARAANQSIKEGMLQTVAAIKSADVTAGNSSGIVALNQRFADFNQRIVAAKTAASDQADELEQLVAATDHVTLSTEQLAKANDEVSQSFARARDARGRFVAGAGGGDDASGSSGDDGGGSSIRGNGLLRAGGQILNKIAPGAGSEAREIGEIVGALGGLGPVALIAAPAVIGVNAVLQQLSKQAEEAHKQLETGLDSQHEYFTLIAQGDAEAVKSYRDQLLLKQKADQEQFDSLKGISEGIAQALDKSFANVLGGSAGDFAKNLEPYRAQLEAAGLLAKGQVITGDTAKDLAARLDELQTSIVNGGIWATKYTDALNDGTVAAQNNIKAQQDAIKQGQQLTIQQVTGETKLRAEIADLQQNGSEDDLKNKRASALAARNLAVDEVNTYQVRIDAAKKNGDDTTYLITEQAKAFRDYNQASDEFVALSDKAIEARVRENDALKEQETIRKQSIELVKQYDDDKAKLDESTAQKQIKLYADLADKQHEIADKAVEDTSKALASLNDKSADLANKLQRTLTGDQADENDKRAKDQRTFLETELEENKKQKDALLKLQRDSDNRILELGLDRDFAGIAREKRALTASLSESNIAANNDRDTRLKRFEETEGDEADNFAKQQRSKIAQYQIQLQDLVDSERKQESTIEDNKRKQLNQLTDKFNKEYGALSSGYATELIALQTNVQQRLAITNEGHEALLKADEDYFKRAEQIRAGNFSGTGPPIKAVTGTGSNVTQRIVATRYAGGSLAAGQLSTVNEPKLSSGFESFSNAQGSINFPGFGMFYPFTSGQVNSGNHQTLNLTMPIYVQGVDAKAVLAEADRQAQKTLAYTIKLMNQRTP